MCKIVSQGKMKRQDWYGYDKNNFALQSVIYKIQARTIAPIESESDYPDQHPPESR